MKLNLDEQLRDPKGEPFHDTSVNPALLWARLRFLARDGKSLPEALDQIEEENGCKNVAGRELVRPMTLGDVIWKACGDSPEQAGTDGGRKKKLAKLAAKSVRKGVVEFDDEEIATIEKQCERFTGFMLLALEDVFTAARAEEKAERERAIEAAKLVATDAREAAQ